MSRLRNAVSSGSTGVYCPGLQQLWNVETQRNLAPERLMDVIFSHHWWWAKVLPCTSASQCYISQDEPRVGLKQPAYVNPSALMSEICTRTGTRTAYILTTWRHRRLREVYVVLSHFRGHCSKPMYSLGARHQVMPRLLASPNGALNSEELL